MSSRKKEICVLSFIDLELLDPIYPTSFKTCTAPVERKSIGAASTRDEVCVQRSGGKEVHSKTRRRRQRHTFRYIAFDFEFALTAGGEIINVTTCHAMTFKSYFSMTKTLEDCHESCTARK